MVDRLDAAGHDVTVMARRPEAQETAEGAGLTWAASVAETVRDADAVFVVVFTDDQVWSVCLGDGNALSAMKSAATLVLHTTCDPATAEALQTRQTSEGSASLMPPLGGPH